ncbi:MAG: cobalamin-dependent protein [Clostridiales bacterium]|nr:cobalamin-dependent protein [Candidatus Crickella merdequi]
MRPAEIFRELLKRDGKPDRLLKQYEATEIMYGDPCFQYLNKERVPGSLTVDRWGVTHLYPKDAPGSTPIINDETIVCPDITRWREFCHAPDLMGNCREGWEPMVKWAEEIRAEGRLATAFMGTGIFEQTHFLMGFENALTAFYEHPDEMHQLIDYILQFRMDYLKLIVENLHPDALLSHDDWGTKTQLFMPPEIWREFFKEPYKKFYGYALDNGVIPIHHADSYLVPILEDMIDVGIKCWQGTLPENNVPEVLRILDGRMIVMGGIGAAIDTADSTEEEIHDYTISVLRECAGYGHFIPCITYGAPKSVFPHVRPVVDAAIDEYNRLCHLPDYKPAPVFRDTQAVIEADDNTNISAGGTSVEAGIMEQISEALQNGQKNKVLEFTQEALEEGYTAQSIIQDGLCLGMNELGEDFSIGEVFVPDMLMAAKCMNAATDMMKPLLLSEGAESIGRACIGTVRGDVHDIGKNLVRIMMEGSGIDVIDLGSDVPPEKFIDTAISEKCDIICCSSLLTTTMHEMGIIVEMAKERGIRDDVIIMVGGAPVTKTFCHEIGADIYTPDAGTAARMAVEALNR